MDDEQTTRILRRDLLLLLALVLCAIGLFLLARFLAAKEQQPDVPVGAIWPQRSIAKVVTDEVI